MAETTTATTIDADAELCRRCGGDCCKRSPGILWPDQVEPLTTDTIARMVTTGGYAIDWWEGDIDPQPGDELDQVYYLRPAIKYNHGLVHASWGGECGFLTPTGCRLPREQRPRQCLTCKASANYPKDCKQPNGHGKENVVQAWRAHQGLLCPIVHELRCVDA